MTIAARLKPDPARITCFSEPAATRAAQLLDAVVVAEEL
jgi:hypothetical protein